MPTKPRLKQGETPQSPAFVKRMRAFNRQVALAEVNEAKAAQDVREAEERANRDITPAARRRDKSKSEAKAKEGATKPTEKTKEKKDRVAESGRSALENRARSIEEAIEGGIQDANDDAQARNRRKKKDK